MTIQSINKTMLGTFTLSMMLAAAASAAEKTAPSSAAPQRGAVTTAPVTPASTPAPAATAPESTPAAMPAVGPGGQQHIEGMPALPSTPAAIGSIIAARPFTVLEPWTNDYRADQSTVSQGWVVVIQAPYEYVLPRQTQEPVLFAGAEAVERVTSVPDQGLILAIVPGTMASDAVPGFTAGSGTSMRPLSETAIWFGTPLPVAVDDVLMSQEIVLAQAAGITARPQSEVSQALATGGSAIEVADRAALFAVIKPWAAQFGVSDDSSGVTPAPAK